MNLDTIKELCMKYKWWILGAAVVIFLAVNGEAPATPAN